MSETGMVALKSPFASSITVVLLIVIVFAPPVGCSDSDWLSQLTVSLLTLYDSITVLTAARLLVIVALITKAFFATKVRPVPLAMVSLVRIRVPEVTFMELINGASSSTVTLTMVLFWAVVPLASSKVFIVKLTLPEAAPEVALILTSTLLPAVRPSLLVYFTSEVVTSVQTKLLPELSTGTRSAQFMSEYEAGLLMPIYLTVLLPADTVMVKLVEELTLELTNIGELC